MQFSNADNSYLDGVSSKPLLIYFSSVTMYSSFIVTYLTELHILLACIANSENL